MRISHAVIVFSLFTVPLWAKDVKRDIPCQKVFMTGTQVHEIDWALKGDGLRNNLYKRTCMQPVADANKAESIIDVELDPKIAGWTEKRISDRESAIASGDYWVSCSSDIGGSYCIDSKGYALETSCSESGCSTYYGPDPILGALHLIGDAINYKIERSSAWAYMFSTKGHKLIWKYEGLGQWHDDLTKYSECRRKPATYGIVCETPKELID